MNANFEALIQRYEAGDRDSELIRQLNELAWEGFHDPWEPGPKRPQDEEDPMEEEFDPKRVQPISAAMIDRHLAARDTYAWKGGDDHYMVQFRYDAAAGRVVRIFLGIEGRGHDHFKLRMVGDRRVDSIQFPEAKDFCNRWNAGYRWPKAFLEVPDLESEEDEGEEGDKKPGADSGLLVLESQYDLSAGIHQALFDDLVISNIRAGWEFWNQAKEQGL